MKTQAKKARHRVECYSLSDIVGTRRGGFFDGCACEIHDLIPQGGSFRLRNGTVETFRLSSPIGFSGSVNNNGNITGYVSSANLLYELPGTVEIGSLSEARYISDGDIDQGSTFFFTSGGCTYMMTSGRILKRSGDEFEDFDSYDALIDVTARSGAVSEDECDRATNYFTGRMAARLVMDNNNSSITLGRAPISVDAITVNGTEVDDFTQNDNVVSIGLDLYEGDVICVYARYGESSPSSLGLIGASGELGGRTYLYNQRAMYKVSLHGGALFCSAPVLVLPEGGLKRAFFCSGTLVLAIGEGLCVFDEEDGTLRIIEGLGARNAESICPCGGFAFVASDGYVTKLTISQSGEREALQAVTVKDAYDHSMRGRVLGMAFSRADRCLWTLNRSEGRNRLFVLDLESGIRSEVTCFDDPTAIVECTDCVAIICSRAIYYSSPEYTMDEREDGSYPISGAIVMNPSDLGDPFTRKRIKSIAIKASSQVTDISVVAVTDRGRVFSESRHKSYGETTLELFEPGLGLFRHISMTVGIKGYGHATLCGIELDVRSK